MRATAHVSDRNAPTLRSLDGQHMPERRDARQVQAKALRLQLAVAPAVFFPGKADAAWPKRAGPKLDVIAAHRIPPVSVRQDEGIRFAVARLDTLQFATGPEAQ